MRPTIPFLIEKFQAFNQLCFEGMLPSVDLRISSSARTMGSLRWRRCRFLAPKAEDFSIWISNRHDVEQPVLEDTLIHEMIHLYIQWNRIKDTSTHGRVFRSEMERINRNFGRNITVSHHLSEEERESDRLRKLRVVMTTLFLDGTQTVTVISPRYTLAILEAVRRRRDIRRTELWVSASHFFARYPQSRTLKFYRVDPSDLTYELAEANRAEIIQGKIHIRKRGE